MQRRIRPAIIFYVSFFLFFTLNSVSAEKKHLREHFLVMPELAVSSNIPQDVFLSQYGTANFSFTLVTKVNKSLSFLPSLKILAPFWDKKHYLLFGQLSYHNENRYNQVNFGLGGRYFGQDFLFGLNNFFDYRTDAKILRLGAGIEYWQDYLKFAINGFFSIGDDKFVTAMDRKARAANGIDARADFYLPQFPEVGLFTTYEKYFGRINFSSITKEEHFIKNEHRLTIGISYTPISLLTFSLGECFSSLPQGGAIQHQMRLSMHMNYRLGVGFSAQIARDNIDEIRKVAHNRYDLVQRSALMVLDYQQKDGLIKNF